MADNTIYDLLDEVNCADSCEAVTALCELIDELLKDIQHLELECISTRYLLSQHEYYVAAEAPVRCGESHHSGQTEPPCY